MQAQFDNLLLNSFLLYLDHQLLTRGSAFYNYSGALTRVSGRISGLNVYTTPYRQLVNDVSVSGANIMSGIYVSGTVLQPGQSGLHSINITEGQALFSGVPSAVSGVFSIKDFSIYLTSKPEEKILFETKYDHRSKYPQTTTGLPQESETFPVIYLKYMQSEDTPLCFGGVDNRESVIRAIILGDSQFMTDAACSIFKDLSRNEFKVIDPTTLPLNAYAAYTGVNYNYTGLSAGATTGSLIWRVRHSNLSSLQSENKLNPQVFPAFVDFSLWNILG